MAEGGEQGYGECFYCELVYPRGQLVIDCMDKLSCQKCLYCKNHKVDWEKGYAFYRDLNQRHPLPPIKDDEKMPVTEDDEKEGNNE